MATLGFDLELQGAIKALLAADSELQAIIGSSPPRIYEEPIDNVTQPYLTIGPSLQIDDSVQCVDAEECWPQIHCWSKTPGFETVKKMSAIVRRILHNTVPSLSGSECKILLYRRTDTTRDPNNPWKHAIVTFLAKGELESEGA